MSQTVPGKGGKVSSGFKVDTEELDELIHSLEDAADDVRNANQKLAEAGDSGQFGDALLANVAQSFEEEWEYGLDKLDEAAEGVIEALEAAKRRYQDMEDEQKDTLDKREREIDDVDVPPGTPPSGGGDDVTPPPAGDPPGPGVGGGPPGMGSGEVAGGGGGSEDAAVPAPAETTPADAAQPENDDLTDEGDTSGEGVNPVTGQPLRTDPETGEPYPIDPETGEEITDTGDDQNVMTVEQGDNTLSMSEPDDQGRMKISLDGGDGTAKSFDLNFADEGENTGDGGAGADQESGGSGSDGAPGGSRQGVDQGHRPGPDGKIHIEDGDLKITAEQPEGSDGPTRVTVDDGSDEPIEYTLGQDGFEDVADSDSSEGGFRGGEEPEGVDGEPDDAEAAGMSAMSPPLESPETPEVPQMPGGESESGVSNFSAPEGEVPAAAPEFDGAAVEPGVDSSAAESSADDTSSQTTAPAAVGAEAGGDFGDRIDTPVGDTEAATASTAEPTDMGAGLGTAPGGSGDSAAAGFQSSSPDSGLLGAVSGDTLDEPENSTIHSMSNAIFDTSENDNRISGSLDDNLDDLVPLQ